MNVNQKYNGGLTREQFLLYEIRVVAKLVSQGYDRQEIFQKIYEENLFQFPTERMIKNLTNVCFKRIDALDSEVLVEELANGSTELAKQINLYAMMRYNRLVWDFMITVIGEKYRTQNLEFSQNDLNLFFFRLQEQDDLVASWSDATIKKIKMVLKRMLLECEYIDSPRSTRLNPVLADDILVEEIKAHQDYEALAAFNIF